MRRRRCRQGRARSAKPNPRRCGVDVRHDPGDEKKRQHMRHGLREEFFGCRERAIRAATCMRGVKSAAGSRMRTCIAQEILAKSIWRVSQVWASKYPVSNTSACRRRIDTPTELAGGSLHGGGLLVAPQCDACCQSPACIQDAVHRFRVVSVPDIRMQLGV